MSHIAEPPDPRTALRVAFRGASTGQFTSAFDINAEPAALRDRFGVQSNNASMAFCEAATSSLRPAEA